MTTRAPITHVASTDIADMLDPQPPGRRMPMAGFDAEFVDIADYIIRITHRIWDQRKLELCRRYYDESSVIHTMTGDITGAATVEKNTKATLQAFPDRTLDGDNVIWSGDEKQGYYTSHRITSRMTNEGCSEFGPPTGRHAQVTTIADCLCKRNKIVEEWLMRDNAALVMQLGLDPHRVAAEQAQKDQQSGHLMALLEKEAQKTCRNRLGELTDHLPSAEKEPEAFARLLLLAGWGGAAINRLDAFYDYRIGAQMPARRSLYGVAAMQAYLRETLACFSAIAVSVDHVASIPYLGEARDIAVRWSMSAVHTATGRFGAPSGARLSILASSHWRVMRGRVREEWTVFDELALRRQIESARLAQRG